jgi:hypothetical protein
MHDAPLICADTVGVLGCASLPSADWQLDELGSIIKKQWVSLW